MSRRRNPMLTPEETIHARDTKIAMLQGALRAMTETAAENSRIKVEDHATIQALRARLAELEAEIALLEGAVDEERRRCILAMWEEPWPTEGHSLESYIAAITKSLNS
jgi:hypothetical protein